MQSARRNVFETNSSSTHSLTMCSESDYDRWQKGELLFDKWGDEFIEKSEYLKWFEEQKKKYLEKYPSETEEDFEEYMEDDKKYYTYDEFWNLEYYETFEDTYTTEKGETVVAFGYYGYDG